MTIDDLNISKKSGDMVFAKDTHSYLNLSDLNRQYISVTTLIHKFEPPFDKDFWSAYKALERLANPDDWKNLKKELLSKKTFDHKILTDYDIPENDFNSVQQSILDDWQKENLKSTTMGTDIHANLENSFYAQKTDISLQKFGLGGKFVCEEGNYDLDLENGIYPEYMIHFNSKDSHIGLAGQIDLLVREGDRFSIIDWKTNKQIKRNSYFDPKTKTSEKMLYPLNDLDSCNYNTYNMQLSTYAYMMEQMHPEWTCNELILVHFDHDDNMTTYKMPYLKEQVIRMLDFWRKESVMERHRAERQRIEY